MSVEEKNRWGIIYSPMLGKRRIHKRWNQIREYLEEKQVIFDYIQSEGFGSVERLANMLANNGYSTVVIVGGDGALQDAVNGIMNSNKAKDVCLGIIPNGISNDFAHYWGLSADNYKEAIEGIIAGRTRLIDLGCCSYFDVDKKVKRYFLNVVNIGLSAHAVEIFNRNSRFAKSTAVILSGFQLLFKRSIYKMVLKINNEKIEEKLMTICIGNSRGFGLTPSAVPYNGWLDVSLISRPEFFGMIKGLWMMFYGHILNHKVVKPYRTKRLKINNVSNARAGIDGRVFKPNYPLEITIEPEILKLIIP